MSKRIFLLAAVPMLTLVVPMAPHAYADQNQPAGAEPAAATVATTHVEPTLPWPLRGLLPI